MWNVLVHERRRSSGAAFMEFIFQPAQNNRLGEFLQDGFYGPWTHFRAAVAFVKSSGTRHIEGALRSFARERDVEIIAGIDHRGSSYEGLESVLQAVSPRGQVIVFHNPTFRTFHPKIYLFKSETEADIVVGSGNLTAGGLFGNYEAGVRLQLRLDEPNDVAFLRTIEDAMDKWGDTSTGTALALDQELLDRLADMGLVLPEPVMGSHQQNNANADSDEAPAQMELPFQSRSEPGSPRLTGGATPAVLTNSASPNDTPRNGFVMTLQRTDMGSGQTTSGTSRRSPEIFIPLAARDANADFWRWPYGFAEDSTRPGKFDRSGVTMRLGSQRIAVNMMTWPDRHDFRLRSERIRSAGDIGDILRMELVIDPASDHEYNVEVIRQGTARHRVYLDLCINPVQNSEKRWGYY